MDYIIIGIIIFFVIVMIAQGIQITRLLDKVEDLEDENEALADVGTKYKNLYNQACVLNTFREPLAK